MKIDLFLCSCADPDDSIRYHLFSAVVARWFYDPDVVLQVVTPEIAKVDKLQFQGYRWRWAEEHATSDIYIVADDDLMPIGETFIERGLEVMNRYKDVAVMCTKILGDQKEKGYTQYEDVLTHNDQNFTANGMRWIRKGREGVREALPTIDQKGYIDGCEITRRIRENGERVWKMKDVWVNHLGEGLSTIWPKRTGMTQISDIVI